MDGVEYLSANLEFAIMREGGAPEADHEKDHEKELEKLLDMRPDSSGFKEKQLVPFLQSYGRHFRQEPYSELPIDGSGEDEGRLKELGYYIYRGKASTPHRYNSDSADLCIDRVDVARDTYIVPITTGYGIGGGWAGGLEGARRALLYIAELGLISQGYGSKTLSLNPSINIDSLTASFTLAPPPSLQLDGSIAQGDIYRGTYRKTRQDDTEKLELEFDLRLIPYTPNPDEQEAVDKTLKALSMFAAGWTLTQIVERRQRPARYVIDPDTLRLRPNDEPDLASELVECIASGKVHPCAHCGRPIMGGTWYCRGRRCKVSDLEKAKLLAAKGNDADEILAVYPHIKRTTIEGYIEDVRRDQQ
jgi:uncharacterized protein (DUF433 family)